MSRPLVRLVCAVCRTRAGAVARDDHGLTLTMDTRRATGGAGTDEAFRWEYGTSKTPPRDEATRWEYGTSKTPPRHGPAEQRKHTSLKGQPVRIKDPRGRVETTHERQAWPVGLLTWDCPGCGGALVIDAGALATRLDFHDRRAKPGILPVGPPPAP